VERDTVLEKCLTEPNPIIRALLSIEHSHYNSYKFTGWRRSRGVRRVGDKIFYYTSFGTKRNFDIFSVLTLWAVLAFLGRTSFLPYFLQNQGKFYTEPSVKFWSLLLDILPSLLFLLTTSDSMLPYFVTGCRSSSNISLTEYTVKL